MPSEKKGIFRNEKVSALLAESRNIYASTAGGKTSLFYDDTLMAGSWEAIVDKVREGRPQIEYRSAFVHHERYRFTAGGFFFAREGQVRRIRIRRMEIEGNGADILRLPRQKAYFAHSIFVDLVHSHVEADIVRSSSGYIRHDEVVSIAAHSVMAFPVAVQTEQDEISFRKIQRKRPVRHHIDDEEAHTLRLYHQIAQGEVAVFPEEGLAAAEEKYAHAHCIELTHFRKDLPVWVKPRSDIVHRAVSAPEIAAVGQNDSSQYGVLPAQEHGLEAESCKVKER